MTPMMLAIVGIILELLLLVVGAVWAVSKIQSTTAVLNETINTLKLTIDQLRLAMNEITKEINEHKAKIAVLESQGNHRGG